jgi:hypothetical protein
MPVANAERESIPGIRRVPNVEMKKMQTTKHILSLALAGAILSGTGSASFAGQYRRPERRHHHHVRLSKNMKRVPKAKSLKKESW